MAVVVVDGLFVKGLAETLHDAAMDLPVHQQRVDDVAAIVHGHVAQDLDWPVSRSTSVTTMCAPKGKVKLGGSQKCVATRPGSVLGGSFMAR